jgi:transposase InsO family protein
MSKDLENLEKLTGCENYHTWAFAIQNYLDLKGLSGCISDPATEIKDELLLKAKATLSLSVSKNLYVLISKCTSATDIWKTLRKRFEEKGLSRKIGLLRNLLGLRYSGDMGAYTNSLMEHVAKLNGIGFEINDEWVASIILAGLTDEFKPFIMGLEASGVEITADIVVTKLLDSQPKGNSDTALVASGSSKKSQWKNKGPRCFQCNKHGHISKNCRNESNKSKADAKPSAKSAFYSACKNDDESSSTKAFRTSEKIADDWYIDSGASRHMTPNKNILKSIQRSSTETIVGANDAKMSVVGEGKTVLNMKHGDVDVNNVLLVPDLGVNLLSVNEMVKRGNTVIFDEKGCTISNERNEILTVCEPKNGTYKLCLLAKNKLTVFDWHRRLAHMGLNSLKKLKIQDALFDHDSIMKVKNCTVCAEGKQTRIKFEPSKTRTEKILELIHTDLMGPMEQESFGGKKYVLTFIDDFSRKIFVYFLAKKNECFEKFVEFKTLIENQTERKIKVIRSDNGTEYTTKMFADFCKKHGIVQQFTTVYTPQQNGVAERFNRTLVEKARCLLFDAKLKKEFWAEAINMATFLINRSQMNKQNKTPEEVFTNEKADLSEIQLFGSKVMVHVPKEKRKKWDRKSNEYVFVGYDNNRKGFRCVDRTTGALIVSRDVKFIGDDPSAKSSEIASKNELIVTENQNDTDLSPIDTEIDLSEDGLPIDDDLTEEEPSIDDNSSENESTEGDTQIDSTIITINSDDGENGVPESDDEISENDEDGALDDPDDTVPDDDARDPTYQPTGSSAEETLPSQPAQGTRSRVNQFNPFNFANFGFFAAEPSCAREAKTDPKWRAAMIEEMDAHAANQTWTIQPLPPGRKTVKSKWVFKTKTNEAGEVVRHKARLVAKGFSQIKGIDYTETFAPVVRFTSIRCLMALAVKNRMRIHQMDAVTAFLQGELSEEIYMDQPDGFEDDTGRVCRLKKSIYGLKQAGREWNTKLDAALIRYGLNKSKMDPCIYYLKNGSLIVAVYVDDFLIFYQEKKVLDEMKKFLCENFLMKDLGPAKACLGLRITQKESSIQLDQNQYVLEILEKFGMSESKPVGTPMSMDKLCKNKNPEKTLVGKIPYQEAIGSLLFLAQCTRPDISFAVNEVSKYNHDHDETHWMAVKRIFRYLRGTTGMKLCFTEPSATLQGFCDADWASDVDERRSCTGYVFKLSGGAISWRSKRQATIALSSTEAEYMALSEIACETIWLRQLLAEIEGKPQEETLIFCDNQSAIKLSKSEAYRPRTKHIDIRHHHIRQLIDRKVMRVQHLSTKIMIADSLTKSVTKEKNDYCFKNMGLKID